MNQGTSRTSRRPAWLWWSSGKDSAWALHTLRRGEAYEVTALVTTVDRGSHRVAVHGVPDAVVAEHAAALGLPLVRVELPYPCPNVDYESAVQRLVQQAGDAGVGHMAFGDLFLEDIRDYRRGLFASTPVDAIFPVWGRDTAALARRMVDAGLRARIVSLDTRVLAPSMLGRDFDHRFLDELPASVDPCGENGEFHTVVLHAPGFDRDLDLRAGGTARRGDFLTLEFELAGDSGV
ncbi:MAG: ATP-binding protein [Acidobacteriota bacterium]